MRKLPYCWLFAPWISAAVATTDLSLALFSLLVLPVISPRSLPYMVFHWLNRIWLRAVLQLETIYKLAAGICSSGSTTLHTCTQPPVHQPFQIFGSFTQAADNKPSRALAGKQNLQASRDSTAQQKRNALKG